ncbi:MAG: hypothetical protein GQ527_01015 [Bacteroidales bacterium]|nr:hypothetical protein [Bacteroidales bacterium]
MKAIQLFYIFIILSSLVACDKSEKLQDDVDPNAVVFVLTQPSISIAQFTAKCTNYDVIVDSIIFLSPENAIYNQTLEVNTFNQNQSFLIGGWPVSDGIWIIQFRGSIQNTTTTFNTSVPYTMNIDDDDDEE